MPFLLALDEGAPKILFRRECVVGLTVEREIPRAVFATPGMRVLVVQLQQPCFSTASTRIIDKGAARPVASQHLAPHRHRH